MTTFEETLEIISALEFVYPRQTLPEGKKELAAEAWHKILGDLPVESVRLAVEDLSGQAGDWMPSVGTIRQKALDLMADDAQLMTAGEAWAEVMREIGRVGHYGGTEFSNPNIKKAVNGIGGWLYLCMSQNLMADRARFFQTFDAYQKRTKQDARMLPAVREFVSQRRQLAGPQPIADLIMYPRLALPPPADAAHD